MLLKLWNFIWSSWAVLSLCFLHCWLCHGRGFGRIVFFVKWFVLWELFSLKFDFGVFCCFVLMCLIYGLCCLIIVEVLIFWGCFAYWFVIFSLRGRFLLGILPSCYFCLCIVLCLLTLGSLLLDSNEFPWVLKSDSAHFEMLE